MLNEQENREENGEQFRRSLGLTDGAMLVIGSMIGSGIFIVSADMIRQVGSPGWLLVVWAVSGALTLIGAITYGELAGMFPRAGGQYVYLRETYGSLLAFLYGWAYFAVIQTGTIAAVGVAFGKFSAYLFPFLSEKNILLDLGLIKISAAQVTAIATIVLLTYINSRGIEKGRWIQLIFTFTKIASLAGLIVLGLTIGFKADIWDISWGDHAWDFGTWAKSETGNQFTPQPGTWLSIALAVAVASVGSLFSMEAWNSVTFVAGEMRNPQRNIGMSLLLGTLTVTVIFLMTNVMYTGTLTPEEIAFAPDDRVGIAAAVSFLGAGGVTLVAVMLMISTFGCNNGLILSGARVYYTMAKDGLFFKKAATLNKNQVPEFALWAQAAWASALCLTGRYGDLLDYVIFTVLVFYILTILGVMLLRLRQPAAPRPYKALGYPVLPIIYILGASFICVSLLIYKPLYSWPGLGIVLLGVPMYYWLVNSEEA